MCIYTTKIQNVINQDQSNSKCKQLLWWNAIQGKSLRVYFKPTKGIRACQCSTHPLLAR
jgi:hypothetical protein